MPPSQSNAPAAFYSAGTPDGSRPGKQSSITFALNEGCKPPFLLRFLDALAALRSILFTDHDLTIHDKGSSPLKKRFKKGDIVPFWRPPLPKRVKRGHLLFDYRQKCVNWTRDILMLKARKMTILAIIMFQENVHEGAFFDREVLGGKDDVGGPNQANLKALAFILWCQKSISE